MRKKWKGIVRNGISLLTAVALLVGITPSMAMAQHSENIVECDNTVVPMGNYTTPETAYELKTGESIEIDVPVTDTWRSSERTYWWIKIIPTENTYSQVRFWADKPTGNFSQYPLWNISKNKTTSLTVKKLKANKKYYVRVRTYNKVNGKKIYSAWSKVKTVKTKK